MPYGEQLTALEITSDTVMRGDVINVGGQGFRVLSLLPLPRGAKRLIFFSGEILTIHRRTRLTATRLNPPGLRPFRRNGRPVASTPENLTPFLDARRPPPEGR